MMKLNKNDRDIILRACSIGTAVININEERGSNVVSQDGSVVYMDILDAKESSTAIKKIVIDAKMAGVIKCMEEDVYILKENNKVTIKDENIKSTFTELECEYTITNEQPKSVWVLNLSAVKRVLYSAAQQNVMKPVLEGVNFNFNGDLVEMATTDGFRGSHFNVKTKLMQGEATANFTIAKHDIQKVLAIFAGEVMVCVADKKVYFMGKATTVAVNKLQEIYIDYNSLERALSAEDSSIELKKSDILNAINICAITTDDGVRLTIDDEHVLCTSVSNTNNTEVSIICSNKNGNANIVFNPKYLLEMISSLNSENITICIGSNGCKVIKVTEEEYSSFLMGIAEQK